LTAHSDQTHDEGIVRVLHVTPSYWPAIGGIEEFVRAICAYSRRTGTIVPEICVCNGGYAGVPELKVIQDTPVRYLRCPGRGPLRSMPDVSRLKQAFDVIHLHDPHVGAITAAFAFSEPARAMVLSTHGGFFHTRRFLALKRLHFATLAPWLLSRVTTVVASSGQDHAYFRAAHPRVERIDNGIDFECFNSVGGSDSLARQDCLYVGRLSANKRLDRLIDTFAELAQLAPAPPVLRIVGEDTMGQLAQLRARASQRNVSDRVQFLGSVPNVELLHLLSRSRFFVSASEYEGFGLAAAEAMAAGVIPLVNDIPAFRAVVRNGESGVLVDYSQTQRAARRIAEVLASPPADTHRMRERAIERAATYSWTHRIYRFLDVYRRAIGATADLTRRASGGPPSMAPGAGSASRRY
jgi:alpha-1,3-mannosyltransferase